MGNTNTETAPSGLDILRGKKEHAWQVMRIVEGAKSLADALAISPEFSKAMDDAYWSVLHEWAVMSQMIEDQEKKEAEPVGRYFHILEDIWIDLTPEQLASRPDVTVDCPAYLEWTRQFDEFGRSEEELQEENQMKKDHPFEYAGGL